MLATPEYTRIGRPRLAQRVRDALERGSLVVTAPAGYGKTTLLEEVLAPSTVPAAWVRCTPSARDPSDLVNALIAAIGDAVPGAAVRLVEVMGASPERVDPVSATAALITELHRLLVDPVSIVLDDAEHLAGSREACAVVGELVRVQSQARVAVASRRPLDIPLAKPRAAGRLDELGVRDLAFTAAELADFATRIWGVAPDDEEVAGLLVATEGWPLGVASLVISGRPANGPTGRGSVRSPADLQAFLAEEVLGSLDEEARGWVMESAVPRYLGPAVTVALGLPDSFLADVRARGLFLRPVEMGNEQFAYHPLVRELLLERLIDERGRGHLAEQHRRAARAAAGARSMVEAIEHWVLAGDWPQVGAVLASEGRTLALRSPDLVRSWIESLPPTVRSQPAIDALAGQLEWRSGNYDAAVALLRSAVSSEQLAGDSQTLWSAKLALVDCLSITGDLAATLPVADGFDAPQARPAGVLAAATALYAAHCLAALGRREEAVRLATRVEALPEHAVVAPIAVMLRAYLNIPAGRLAAAEDEAAATLQVLERDDPLQLRFNVMTVIAIATAEQGRLEDALEWWRRIAAEGSALLLTGKVAAAQGFQAMLLAQLDRFDEAQAVLSAHSPVPAWIGYSHHVARAIVASARGSRRDAIDAAAAALECVRRAAPVFRFWAAAEVVPVLAGAGMAVRARRVLAEAEAVVDATFQRADSVLLRARVHALRGWLTACEAGDVAAGVEHVVRLLAEAGDVAPYVLRREWGRLASIISEALADDALDAASTVGWLSQAFPDGMALVSFAEHPNPTVRRAAVAPALASGHPAAKARAATLCDDPDPSVATVARAAVARAAVEPLARIFTTLGGFAVRRGAFRIDERDWARPVDARLLRFLLVRDGVPTPDDVLFEALWPDLSPANARRSLQVSASRVRTLLDHPGATESIIDGTRGAYRLRMAAGDVVDWQQFESAARAALAYAQPPRRLLEHARSAWGGEPLPQERYSHWATAWRERLTERYLQVLAALVECCGREGDHGAAIVAARGMVDLDPLNESAHRQLMAAYARGGRREQALRQYLECRRALVVELGVEPAEITARLHAAILAGEDV